MLINPYLFVSAAPPIGNMAIMPFTYDETDKAGFLSFTRQGNGPHQTPDGLEGDGYEVLYKSTTIPSWMSSSSAAFGLQLTFKGYCHPRADANVNACPLSAKDTFDTIFHMGTDSSTPQPKATIGLGIDPASSGTTIVQFNVQASVPRVVHMGRINWRFALQTPEYQSGGNTWVPQAILFKDATHLWISAHLNDTKSRVWEVNPSTGALLRFFDFPLPYTHVANLCRRSNGDIWFTDSPTSLCGIVDMEASFTSGLAVITTVMDTTAFDKIGAIDFTTISGTEYFIAAEYKTSGTPYLYAFPASAIGAVTLTAADRYKRWEINLQIQGLCVSSGKLRISCNTGRITGSQGFVERYDMATVMATADGSNALRPEWSEFAASGFPEDCCVHPVTGDIWMPTEGNGTPVSDRAYLSVWSSPVNGTGQENTYNVDYDGAGNFTFKINGNPYYTLADTPSVGVATVCLCGPPTQTPSFTNGYMFGFVKNVAIKDAAITTPEYDAIRTGTYEANSLTVYSLTMVNPGAETGDTTGWTFETGNMDVFPYSTLPTHTGLYSFYAGNQALCIGRQRIAVPSGADAAIDAGNAWVKARVWQANNDGMQDPGGIGIRTLDASSTQLSETYSGIAVTPLGNAAGRYPWWPRAFEVAAPNATRNVDILFKSTRTDGTNNDTYADDFSMAIYVK
jgi:hypothetical protein